MKQRKKQKDSTGIDPQKIFSYWSDIHTETENREFFGEHYDIVQKMIACRNPKLLGYHKYVCSEHPEEYCVVPYTCKVKICSSCAKIQTDKWTEEIKTIFPKTSCFHITLTMPKEFRDFFSIEDPVWKRRSDFYRLGWETVSGFFRSRNSETGCMVVLHTFGRAALINPHLHIIVLGGGLRQAKNSPNGYKYIKHECIPKEYIRTVWQRNLLQYVLENTVELAPYTKTIMTLLKKRNQYDQFGTVFKKITKIIKTNTPEKDWEKWIKVIIDVDYYIHIKKKGDKAKESANYVARYTRRLPISKSRILEFDTQKGIVKYCYQPHNEDYPVISEITIEQFLRRLLQHVPPKGFNMIRYYGILSSRETKKFRPILEKMFPFEIPEHIPFWRQRQKEYTGKDPFICSCCHQEMILVEKCYPNSSGKLIHKFFPPQKEKTKNVEESEKAPMGKLYLLSPKFLFLDVKIHLFRNLSQSKKYRFLNTRFLEKNLGILPKNLHIEIPILKFFIF